MTMVKQLISTTLILTLMMIMKINSMKMLMVILIFFCRKKKHWNLFIVETPMYTNRSFPPLDEPLSLYLFFFVILFKTKFLTDDQTELLMECMNVVLLFTNMKYRFPVKATTLLSSSELLKRCYEGVTQYSVCKGCHRLYRLNENGRSTVTVCRKCDESLIIGGTNSSHLPKMLFEYNSIVSTLKKWSVLSIKIWTNKN